MFAYSSNKREDKEEVASALSNWLISSSLSRLDISLLSSLSRKIGIVAGGPQYTLSERPPGSVQRCRSQCCKRSFPSSPLLFVRSWLLLVQSLLFSSILLSVFLSISLGFKQPWLCSKSSNRPFHLLLRLTLAFSSLSFFSATCHPTKSTRRI